VKCIVNRRSLTRRLFACTNHIHASLVARELGFKTVLEPAAKVNYLAFSPTHLPIFLYFGGGWSHDAGESSIRAFCEPVGHHRRRTLFRRYPEISGSAPVPGGSGPALSPRFADFAGTDAGRRPEANLDRRDGLALLKGLRGARLLRIDEAH